MVSHYNILHYLSLMLLLCSCVDEFDAGLSDTETRILVIEGTIVSDSDCTFHLSHSLPLQASTAALDDCQIADAQVSVRGSDGQSWTARLTEPGSYVVPVGHLSSEAQYWLTVNWEGHDYASSPQSPLTTPAIASISFEQPRSDQEVDILVTPNQEVASSTDGSQYFRWNFEEYWEVRTPLTTIYDYSSEFDSIFVTDLRPNRGWCQKLTSTVTVASNADYVDGQIRGLRLHTLDRDDVRFGTRYCIQVTQTAINREEYEYETLSARLSDEMGGLFTPQPSSLPTNVTCQDADLQVIGYIGVSQNVATRRLYIDRAEVGSQYAHAVDILDEERAREYTWAAIYALGYRPYQYFPDFNSVTWVARCCVDCTDPVWGASLTPPDWWESSRE